MQNVTLSIFQATLLDPEGQLSDELPSTAANDAVLAMTTARQSNGGPKPTKRGPYVILTRVQQAEEARFAILHGNKAGICRYSKEYSTEIKDRSVNTRKSKYVEEFDCKRKGGVSEENEDVVVHSIPQKKRGRPLLLGHELDDRAKKYIKEARKVGTPMDTTVVMASGEAIVRKTDKIF